MADEPVAKCSKCEKRKAKYTFKACSHPFCDECFHGQPKEACGMYLIVSCHCGTSESFKKPPAAAKFRFNNNAVAVSCHCGTSESFKKPPAAAKFRFNNNAVA